MSVGGKAVLHFPFSQRTKIELPILLLKVKFQHLIETLQLEVVLPQIENFMKLSGLWIAVFQVVFGGARWDCGTAGVGKIQFVPYRYLYLLCQQVGL